jgi:hypothetical protein
MRRIKSVALSIPCVVGPYTSLNCTLRLLEHKFRVSALASGAADYPETTERNDERFRTVNVPIASIAASSGQNDSGIFEMNFRDERYIPFEGAGAISRWRIDLPSKVRQFDYGTIADAILHVRYTAVDGGDKLRSIAQDHVQAFLKGTVEMSRREGFFTLLDLRSDFPNEWGRVTQATGPASSTMTLAQLGDHLPFFTKGSGSQKILASKVYLFWRSATGTPKAPTLQPGSGDPEGFAAAKIIEQESKTKTFATADLDGVLVDTWKIVFDTVPGPRDSLWLIVKYALG